MSGIFYYHHRVAKINPVLFRRRKSGNLKQSQQSLSCIMSSSSSTVGSSNQMSMSKITPLRRKSSKDEILLRPKNKLDALHWSPQSATWYCETTSLTCHRMARGILPLLPSRHVVLPLLAPMDDWLVGWWGARRRSKDKYEWRRNIKSVIHYTRQKLLQRAMISLFSQVTVSSSSSSRRVVPPYDIPY